MNRIPVNLATASPTNSMHVGEQLAFYFFAGIFLPAAAWSLFRGIPLDNEIPLFTLLCALVANVMSWYSLTRLRTYGSAKLLSYVFPANIISFGSIFAVISLVRLSFSFSLFLTCAASTLVISYLITTRIRHADLNLLNYVVPGGASDRILERDGFLETQSVEAISKLVDEGAVNGSIVADLHHDHTPEWERLLAKAALNGIPVYHYRLIEEALSGEVRINHLRENELGSLIPNLPYRYAKRVLDVLAVLLLAPLLLPVIGILALIIKLDSKGSALFRQERVGFRGETFRMVKLRTMSERKVVGNKNQRREDAKTKENDARITRVGKILRKTRLDELPQAWNVLLGEMSWIGPRPEACDLAEWHEGEIPFYSYRHIVRPGITGWSQVNQGHVTDLEAIHAKLRYDFYYVKNLSLWLDILIALRTLRVMAQGIGAK